MIGEETDSLKHTGEQKDRLIFKYEQQINQQSEIIKQLSQLLNSQSNRFSQKEEGLSWINSFNQFANKVSHLSHQTTQLALKDLVQLLKKEQNHLFMRKKLLITRAKEQLQEQQTSYEKLEIISKQIREIVSKKLKQLNLPTPSFLAQQPLIWQKWDTTTPYACKFKIEAGKVTKWAMASQFQVVSLPLPHTGIHFASLLIKYRGNRGINVGIITESRRIEEWSAGEFHHQTLSYSTNPVRGAGTISMDRKEIMDWSEDLFIKHGEVIHIEIGIDSQTVTFANSNRKCEVKLAESFVGKQLYLFITMSDDGDSATFI